MPFHATFLNANTGELMKIVSVALAHTAVTTETRYRYDNSMLDVTGMAKNRGGLSKTENSTDLNSIATSRHVKGIKEVPPPAPPAREQKRAHYENFLAGLL